MTEGTPLKHKGLRCCIINYLFLNISSVIRLTVTKGHSVVKKYIYQSVPQHILPILGYENENVSFDLLNCLTCGGLLNQCCRHLHATSPT